MATLSDLKQDHKNARKRTETSASLLKESLQRYGPARSIVIDEDDRILAGNGTVEAALGLGIEGLRVIDANPDEIIAVRRTGLTEDQKVGLALADNRTADLAEWDAEMLHRLSEEHDIAPWFEDDDVKALLEQVEQLEPEEGNTDPDEAPEPPEDPITKPGDLWILGKHRLLCGDSTNIQHVERLMDGKKADMVFTDPPYGVNYEGGHFHSGDVNIKRKREKLANDADDQIYADVIPLIASFCDGPCYTWFADTKPLKLYQAVEAVGQIHALIIWHKINAKYAAMNAQYKQRHEPCLYWKPKGSTLRWCGASTEATLWEMKRDPINNFHPTQKPVELAERAIGNHKAQTVLDLFGGSGSTLIACERQHRHARLMELDPAYCDVIVKRWEDFTGNTAVCVPSETHFDEPEDDI
jgi:DNA modification methylase